jgi:hypothetical protein
MSPLPRCPGNLAILFCLACGSTPPPPPPAPNTTTFTLSCASPIGAITSDATFTFVASADPVKSGGAVTYTLTPPSNGAQMLSPTFISSTSEYVVPAGLTIDSVAMQESSTADYSTLEVALDGGEIELTELGSFTMNSTPRPVPPFIIDAHVTAASGGTISWMPPIDIVGEANAGIFGTQTSSCTIENPSPLGTTQVE